MRSRHLEGPSQFEALRFVRKVSGYRIPSAANAAVFEASVDDVATAMRRLLDGFVVAPTSKPVELLQRRRAQRPDAS